MTTHQIVQERIAICSACEQRPTCKARFQILDETPRCPLNKLRSKADLIAAKAWPPGVERISGCCDAVGDGWGGE